jgi:hypothetical protein
MRIGSVDPITTAVLLHHHIEIWQFDGGWLQPATP